MFRRIAAVALTACLTATALIGAAHAQVPGRYQGYGQPYNVQMPQQQPQMGGDARQILVGAWQIQTRTGGTYAEYRPDGSVSGMVTVPNSRRPIPFQGQYSVQDLGNGRIALTIMTPVQGKMTRSTNTLRMMPDGNLFNETVKAVAYRVQ